MTEKRVIMGANIYKSTLIFSLLLSLFSLVGCSIKAPALSESSVLSRMMDEHNAIQKNGNTENSYVLVIGYPKGDVIDLYGLYSLQHADRLELYGVHIGSYLREEDQIPDNITSIQLSDMYIDLLDFNWILKAENIMVVDLSLAKIEGDALDYFLHNTRSSHISLEGSECDLLISVESIVQNLNIRSLDLRSYAGANDKRVQELREKRPDIEVLW